MGTQETDTKLFKTAVIVLIRLSVLQGGRYKIELLSKGQEHLLDVSGP
jgi:hypothetical protein